MSAHRSAAGEAITLYVAIAMLQKRLAHAQAERQGWHAAGNEEKYLAAAAMVEALRLQLLEHRPRHVAAPLGEAREKPALAHRPASISRCRPCQDASCSRAACRE